MTTQLKPLFKLLRFGQAGAGIYSSCLVATDDNLPRLSCSLSLTQPHLKQPTSVSGWLFLPSAYRGHFLSHLESSQEYKPADQYSAARHGNRTVSIILPIYVLRWETRGWVKLKWRFTLFCSIASFIQKIKDMLSKVSFSTVVLLIQKRQNITAFGSYMQMQTVKPCGRVYCCAVLGSFWRLWEVKKMTKT